MILLVDEVTQQSANLLVAQLFLELDNPDKDIVLYINSSGGSGYAGMAVYDRMPFIKLDVSTLSTGFTAAWVPSPLAVGGRPAPV